MKNKIVNFIFVFFTIVGSLLIVWLIVNSFFIRTTTVIIGPHNPTTWNRLDTLTGNNVGIQTKSDNVFTIQTDNGDFVTAGTPTPLVLGQKYPDFLTTFTAEESKGYKTSTTITIFSTEDIEVSFSRYPIGDNLIRILFIILIWFFITVLLAWIVT